MTRTVRIGGASGFWGDSSVGAPQLVGSGMIDYLVFDYLAETTMAILAGARAKNPELGYTPYLVERFQAVLPACVKNKVRIVTNRGAANPAGAARVVRPAAPSNAFARCEPASACSTAARARDSRSSPGWSSTG